jgi:hypothetical protein
MKRIIIIVLLLSGYGGYPADQPVNGEGDGTKRLNFFISTHTKGLDPAMKSAQWQARLRSLFHKKLYFILADDANEMAIKMVRILEQKQARVGCIWFDSHGNFSRRYSSFQVGSTEFSYQSLQNAATRKAMEKIAPFIDTCSIIGVGSCYGGASFPIPAVDGFPEQQMKGDSLLISLGRLLNGATVFGSESFVMCRPGMFRFGYSLAGRPMRKKFSDPVYRPVWEHLGQWNCYLGRKDLLMPVPTVRMDQEGNISCNKRFFLSFPQRRHQLARKLAKLKKGNYDLSFFYQHITGINGF